MWCNTCFVVSHWAWACSMQFVQRNGIDPESSSVLLFHIELRLHETCTEEWYQPWIIDCFNPTDLHCSLLRVFFQPPFIFKVCSASDVSVGWVELQLHVLSNCAFILARGAGLIWPCLDITQTLLQHRNKNKQIYNLCCKGISYICLVQGIG